MKRSVLVALAIPLEDEYWRGVIHGILKLVGNTQPWTLTRVDPTAHEVERLVKAGAGAMIAAVGTPQMAEIIKTANIPCVNVSSAVTDAGLTQMHPDDVDIGQLAATHFLKRGIRNFAYVGVALRNDSAMRQNGFGHRLSKESLELQSTHLLPSTPSDSDLEGLQEWLEELPAPGGIFVLNDSLALRVMDACHAAGIKIPKDQAILGVGDDPIVCGLATPRLSSVSLPAERVGYEAAALLEAMMASKRRQFESQILPVSSVIARGSSDIVSIDDPQVATAMRFILAHAGEWIGVRELLLSMPIQRRSLERRFRAALGRSPLEEIRRVRIEIARELLATTDLPMPLVARRSGFSEAKQLSTVFRAEVGITPTAYRSKFRVAGPKPVEERGSDGSVAPQM
jgi:LacI family transcriptional regulator